MPTLTYSARYCCSISNKTGNVSTNFSIKFYENPFCRFPLVASGHTDTYNSIFSFLCFPFIVVLYSDILSSYVEVKMSWVLYLHSP